MADDSLRIADDFPQATLSSWRAVVEKELKGAPYDALLSRIEGELPVQPLYHDEGAIPDARSGFPGLPPYRRGAEAVRAEWVLRQEYDDPRMDVCAAHIREDLARGVDAIFLRCGVHHGTRVLTAGDLDMVLESVDLGTVSICLEPEADALPVAAAFLAVATHRGVPHATLRGGFGADPLGSLARAGSLLPGLAGTTRAAVDLAVYSAEHAPGMRALLASSRPYADAGATSVTELAFTIATATSYLRALTGAGLSVDQAASQIQFALSSGSHFFAQIAKLRAARVLWSKVVAAAGGSAIAQRMSLHARTATFTKSARDPWVNMLRGTAESFAAIAGGADSVSTAPFDECLGPSDAFARRIARNTQLVLREESNLHRVIDPAGGSYYVEALTDSLARAAWDAFREVERLGGMEQALPLGHVAKVLAKAKAERLERIRHRKDPVVGVSEFANLTETLPAREGVDMQDVDVELGHPLAKRAEGPAAGGARDQDVRIAKLDELRRTVGSSLVKSGKLTAIATEAATLGVDFITMGGVLASGQASVHIEPLVAFRAASPFEALRARADAIAARSGEAPRVALVCLGPVAQHTARATWTTNALAAGGVGAYPVLGFAGPEDVGGAFSASGCDVAVVAGADAAYSEQGPAVIAALRTAGAKHVVVAGKPGELEQALRDAGAAAFLYAGQDLVAFHVELHRQLGDLDS
jgi:methylmalonyl-CoA mutase